MEEKNVCTSEEGEEERKLFPLGEKPGSASSLDRDQPKSKTEMSETRRQAFQEKEGDSKLWPIEP
jgi:hypothetical protein